MSIEISDTGLIEVLLERLEKQRLPRLLDIEKKLKPVNIFSMRIWNFWKPR